MRYVAFLRNLNQGQAASPTSAALIASFERIGASEVETFRSNGTVAFTSSNTAGFEVSVAEFLSEGSRWSDAVFVRSLDWVSTIVAMLERNEERHTEVSVFGEAFVPTLPLLGRRCRVERGGAGFAVTVNERAEESNATSTLERAMGTPVTSRGLSTMRRLVGRESGSRTMSNTGGHATRGHNQEGP
jgi:uncharacterized protein (DUF1697 family)